jgi:hypothetical protein
MMLSRGITCNDVITNDSLTFHLTSLSIRISGDPDENAKMEKTEIIWNGEDWFQMTLFRAGWWSMVWTPYRDVASLKV